MFGKTINITNTKILLSETEELMRERIDAGIDEGIADIEVGRFMELRCDNIEKLMTQPIFEW